jgi:AcrR family transcriptional regulator
MPFVKDETEETKHRIIDVAERHFSHKGFDGTRVDEIAKDAGVNKALIYYYFKSKEEILDHLIKTLFDDIASIAREFIRSNVVAMIKEGQLDIQQDRWSFATQADAQNFYRAILKYNEKAVDFILSHRRVVRILIFESLKNSKHHNDLFRMLDLLNKRDEDSFYQMIWSADQDFAYSTDTVVYKFFFGFVPIFNFAAYFDDYLVSSGMEEAELRASFLRAYEKMALAFTDGKDIFF